MATEQELMQIRRRRGNMLKFIRQGHEEQLERMNDFMMQRMMQGVGSNMSIRQVLTMLQDLQTLGLVNFNQRFCEIRERQIAEQIMLTAPGLTLAQRRKDTEEVVFD